MNKDDAKPFAKIIEKMIEKKIKKMKIPNTRVAQVDSINLDKTVNIIIPPSETTIHNLINKTGETLSIGDSVFLLLIDGTMSNAVVWLKRKSI